MNATDYAREFELLEAAQAAGRCDGEGPADVAPIREIPVATDEEQHDTDSN